MKKDLLQQAAEDLESQHSITIKKRAEQANVRAVELLWSTLVQKYHHHKPAVFTGIERQAIRNLTTGYGIHNFLLYITETIKNWQHLRETKEFSVFPLVPTFQIFYHYHRSITPLIDLQKVRKFEEQEKLRVRQEEERKQTEYKPPKSLTEMVLEQKRKNGATITKTTTRPSK